jgi:hypothetical protein
MNKPLDNGIKDVLFRYINIIFNISETSDMFYGIQIINGDDYYYEITYQLEKIARMKKAGFYTIDLEFEDFGMNEIDERGNYIIPLWLKNKENSIIFVYGIDELSKKNYKIRELVEILKKQKIKNIKIPSNKHFIFLSNRDLKAKANLIKLDIKRAVDIINKKKESYV